MSRNRAGDPDKALLTELAAIYADVDVAYEGWSCPASTECCHFSVTGLEPYVTSIELLAITRAIAAMGGPVAVRRKAEIAVDANDRTKLPLLASPAEETGRCPLLASTGRCSIYAARPLGCRTFYCDRASEGAAIGPRDVNAFVHKIQAIAERHEPSGDRGRPLTRALRTSLARHR
jgi:Fe-S-cluster containining protein